MPTREDYDECEECGEFKRVYECHYCDARLCWDCLQEHKREYHRIEKQ